MSRDDENPATARQYWDEVASTFDEQPDHGLRDAGVRAAWGELLQPLLPPAPAAILDVGCGTGSLSVLLAELGYALTGIDLSPAMIALSRAKAAAAGQNIAFAVMDATIPQFPDGTFDALLCRHLLWALPEPAQVLRRWAALLKPAGRMLLIEGFWSAGAGLHAAQVADMLPAALAHRATHNLSDRPALWGKPVGDERYLVEAVVNRPV